MELDLFNFWATLGGVVAAFIVQGWIGRENIVRRVIGWVALLPTAAIGYLTVAILLEKHAQTSSYKISSDSAPQGVSREIDGAKQDVLKTQEILPLMLDQETMLARVVIEPNRYVYYVNLVNYSAESLRPDAGRIAQRQLGDRNCLDAVLLKFYHEGGTTEYRIHDSQGIELSRFQVNLNFCNGRLKEPDSIPVESLMNIPDTTQLAESESDMLHAADQAFRLIYKRPAECERPPNWAAQVECGNHFMRENQKFREKWMFEREYKNQ